MSTVPATQQTGIAPGQSMETGPGGLALTQTGETNQAQLAAQAEAQIRARYVIADRRPRSWDNVRIRILGECKRPSFAKAARYLKPIGQGVAGPSIRFAEACMRYAGNMSCDVVPMYEDRHKRILLIAATDYETNASYSATITVPKTVERRQNKGRVVVSQRMNSYGETVYIVEATEDELLNTQNALVSKAARTLILRLIPGDIIEEAQNLCIEVHATEDAKDPTAARKKAFEAWASIGVMPTELGRYFDCAPDAITNAQLREGVALFNAIKDNETTWSAAMEAKHGDKPSSGGAKPTGQAQAKAVTEKVKAKTGAKKETVDPQTGEIKDADIAPSDNADDPSNP